MFEKLGQPQDALRASRIAVEREPNKQDAHFKVGWFAFLNGDFDGSIEATRRGLTLQPTSAMAEFNLGVALLASGDIVAAEAAYRRGVALARRSVPAIGLQEWRAQSVTSRFYQTSRYAQGGHRANPNLAGK